MCQFWQNCIFLRGIQLQATVIQGDLSGTKFEWFLILSWRMMRDKNWDCALGWKDFLGGRCYWMEGGIGWRYWVEGGIGWHCWVEGGVGWGRERGNKSIPLMDLTGLEAEYCEVIESASCTILAKCHQEDRLSGILSRLTNIFIVPLPPYPQLILTQ